MPKDSILTKFYYLELWGLVIMPHHVRNIMVKVATCKAALYATGTVLRSVTAAVSPFSIILCMGYNCCNF